MTERQRSTRAKLNLTLSITGRREDGYHLLHSIVAFAGYGDRLTVAAANGLSLAIEGPFAKELKEGSDNSILAAARLLAGGEHRGAAFRLEKNLPLVSGIGGGSGDAAAALRLLNHLWRLQLDEPELARQGLLIGADVPVCLYERACVMEGIGERLLPLERLPAWHAVMVHPGVACPTQEIFGIYRQDRRVFSAVEPMREATDFSEYLDRYGNDLEPGAIALRPVIGEAIAVLAAVPHSRFARMSGSGATCFAIFDEEGTAANGAETIGTQHPDWWVRAAPLF